MDRNARIIVGILVALGVILLIFFIARNDANDVIPNDQPPINGIDNGTNGAQAVLNQLPRQVTVGDRQITMDTTTVAMEEDRDEYAQRPTPMPMMQGESPVDYIERYLNTVTTAEHIQDQPEHYEFYVSFYERNNGLSAFIRVENIPDDSIGQGEERFDFSQTNANWTIDWYGERIYCQRPGQEFWQPSDQMCP